MRIAVAPRGYEHVLLEELGDRVLETRERLVFFDERVGPDPLWAQNIWLEPVTYKFKSISDAAARLREIQRSWHLHSTGNHRRASLIADKLPPLKVKRWPFPSKLPTAPLGAWTLLNESEILYSAKTSSPLPDGEIEFIENKTEPPSRAYLKLWEIFTLTGRMPKPGDKVIDVGSSPGGWTWVLDQLECEVISVDKAPLGRKFSKRVRFIEESAFALKTKDIGQMDWFFSDVICYPERLLEMIRNWRGFATNFVCTIKMQEPTDFAILKEFLKIEGSQIRHLSCNKHEVTWTYLADLVVE